MTGLSPAALEAGAAEEPDGEERETWFTSIGVTEYAGITYRMLDYWCRQGHLHPEQHRNGSGGNRVWPPGEAEIARRMARLAVAGLPLAWSADFARNHWPLGLIAEGIAVVVTEPPRDGAP